MSDQIPTSPSQCPRKLLLDLPQAQNTDRVLSGSFCAALILMLSILQYLSTGAPVAHVTEKVPVLTAIEAELFEKPVTPTHVLAERSPTHRAAVPEKLFSVTPGFAKSADAAPFPAVNQVVQGAPPILTHGPVVISAPSPRLPVGLRDQNLKTSVLIEFTVDVDGRSTPHLVGSSGNDELDAAALRASRDWRFDAAMIESHPVLSKVRLRINFQVE